MSERPDSASADAPTTAPATTSNADPAAAAAAAPAATSRRTDAVAAWESLYRAQVSVLRHIRSRFPEGVSFTEYDVLFTLSRAPGRALRIRDLNRHLLLTQPSVSRLLDRLVARGLVSKCTDPDDARGTIATLTDEGYTLFRRVGAEHGRDIADRMLTSLDDDELAELRRLSDKLRGSSSPERPDDVDAVPPPPATADSGAA
ncbi:MarR family winged helix-turn-helix transcriptional regulator [Schumannella sp. 10F1B-5-1]|uniref:MarR family winged helix-turn-helix transcriptional regulator n=1 Tax=Schumannella sp. 10F1B-5-1 TaxID=2590780 RepID=UPI001132071B|nr:winged helix-turn-helix transcriptional regulator [Schumannella sp. 10F1B-5-1]